jgi:hypothetical protein
LECFKRLDRPNTRHPAVQHLSLSWNGLENTGCTRIAAALAENHGLRSLDLSCTRMGNPACSVLAAALIQNTTIDTLLVNGNTIGDQGTRILAQALSQNCSLRHLGLEVRRCSRLIRSLFLSLSPFPASNLIILVLHGFGWQRHRRPGP